MNAITKPMLATKCECPRLLKFPVLATPKLDGIRCLKLNGKAVTRSFKPISNRFAREWIRSMTNQNAAELDAFGRTKRSLAQAGMVGRNELGGFVVRHLKTGVEFRLGYNHITGGIDRVTLWLRRETLVGKVVKFSHQPSGAKDAPRFPKFIGFREAWDM
ncbi:MAG: hypothetical protein K9N23_06415 [Akkermansiaceae bacterium]|nr:hypothetical protein [Akkermansiaceae bacterium]MCF7731299.1 hypothetical protein [Akkermansiaceae bacterium]